MFSVKAESINKAIKEYILKANQMRYKNVNPYGSVCLTKQLRF